jgi:hypothetical protein
MPSYTTVCSREASTQAERLQHEGLQSAYVNLKQVSRSSLHFELIGLDLDLDDGVGVGI